MNEQEIRAHERAKVISEIDYEVKRSLTYWRETKSWRGSKFQVISDLVVIFSMIIKKVGNKNMSGQWTKRESDEHVCSVPQYGESREKKMNVGDEWTCAVCGSIHKVTRVEYGNQRDPIPQGYATGWEIRNPGNSLRKFVR